MAQHCRRRADLADADSNGSIKQQEVTGNVDAQWAVTRDRQCNGDGKSDIAWLGTPAVAMTWLMNGFTPAAIQPGNFGTAWAISGANSD